MRDIVAYTDEYVNLPFEKHQVYYRRKKVLECIEKYQHGRVLEIGCGCEPIFEHVDSFSKWVIVEPSRVFYEIACEKANDSFNRDKILCINDFLGREKLQLSKHKYDFIILSSLLHEVENPEAFIGDIKTLCSEETIVHINVPNALSIHRILAKEMNIISDIFEKSGMQKKMQQYSIFSLQILKNLVEEFGFDILEEGSYFVKPFTHKQMQRCLDEEIFDEQLLDGLYNIISLIPEYGSEIYVNIRIRG